MLIISCLLSPYFAVLYPQHEFNLIRSSGIMLLARPLSVNYLILLSPCFAVLYPQPEINLVRSSGICCLQGHNLLIISFC